MDATCVVVLLRPTSGVAAAACLLGRWSLLIEPEDRVCPASYAQRTGRHINGFAAVATAARLGSKKQ
uniref:Putative secreted protein n=1 Tax=Anopheles triannulatus TaxID=58253 RepID=A0A2M4B7Y3_9DIPT